ncbi:MAG: hypothetical protein LBE56_14635 [Tannerella sp.]|jgi:hypothetical protein|nr:hypothetical protein [Tannerella sp.]
MKNYLKILLAGLILITVSACKTLVADNPQAIPPLEAESKGYITIRTTGTGSKSRRAMIDGERQAFKDLFFRGYPQAQQKIPMIGVNEVAIMQQHKAYFDQFFGMTELGPNRYRSFVISSHPVGKFSNKQLTLDVVINLRALRADLEQNGLIRKFGY